MSCVIAEIRRVSKLKNRTKGTSSSVRMTLLWSSVFGSKGALARKRMPATPVMPIVSMEADASV